MSYDFEVGGENEIFSPYPHFFNQNTQMKS